jgi:DNA sulfur modification protein DndB
MATTVFTIKGKLGTTEYYVITMKAGEVVSKIRIPKDVDGWEDLGIEECYQREINDSRVKNLIAPYLANDEDRFFGALLVTMQNSDDIEFEPLEDVVKKLPAAYQTPASGAGFLTLTGGETLFPIDGQHRLRALKYAIDGKDSSGKDLSNFQASSELSQEDVVVILFKFNTQTSRKIFTKVNKYAKPTTKAQNLITDDDDVIAVITRKIANDMIGTRMVNFKSNTLANNSVEFTTLATLYECISIIVDAIHGKIDKTSRPDKAKERLYTQSAEENFVGLVEKVDHFKTILTHTDEAGDERRIELRSQILLAKPIAQLCLVKAFMQIKNEKTPDGRTPTDTEIYCGLNAIDWALGSPTWQKILMNGNKIMSGKGTIKLATDFIVHFAGFMSEENQVKLLEHYKNSFTEAEQKNIRSLPKPRL